MSESETYRTLDAAIAYLHEQGWKRTRAMLAKDTNEGKIARTEDGAYSQKALDAYGRAHCKPLTGVLRRDERMERLLERKLVAETELQETKNRLAQREEQIRNRELLPADEVFRIVAGLFAQIRADWENVIYGKVGESIVLCRGDEEWIPDLTAFWLAEKAKILDRFFRAWRDAQPLLVPKQAIKTAMASLAEMIVEKAA